MITKPTMFNDYIELNSKSYSGGQILSTSNILYYDNEVLLQYMFNYILREYADEIENYIFELDFEIIENN